MSSLGPHFFRVEVVGTDDAGEMQTLTVKGVAGEELTGVHRIQYFGDTGHVPKGSHGLALDLYGDRKRVVLLGTESAPHRPTGLEEGDRRIYDMHGNVISLVKAGMRIVAPVSLTIVSPEIVLEGEVHLGGKGGRLVHRKDDVDSGGDAAVGSATKVYAF